MALPKLKTTRFTSETGVRILVQVPEDRAQIIVDAVLGVVPLRYGDYEKVTFRSAAGMQQFQSLGSGYNAATKAVSEVPCTELSFFLENNDDNVTRVVETIYSTHPYEEPVIFVESCLRTLHIRGQDEDNPNRFWNAPPADWVPEEHR